MKEIKKGNGRPPRYDSFPLGFATPRWDAGIRTWPGGLLLCVVLVTFVAFTIVFGMTRGPLLTAAIVVGYPLLLLTPIRTRFVPREVSTASSPVPIRLWVLGWLCIAVGTALYPLIFAIEMSRGGFVAFLSSLLVPMVIYAGTFMVARAPSWERWRQRPRKNRRAIPFGGSNPTDGTATTGQGIR